jgi:hypothetical protein
VPEFVGAAHHRSLALAITAAASGDSALARIHADTLLRVGAAELEARRARGGVDPFARQSLIESQMAVGLALRGEHERAVQLAEGAAARLTVERDAVDGTGRQFYLALTQTLVGRRADAISTLRRLLALPGDVSAPMLRLDPTFDSLRGEPAFQQLLAIGR